MLDFEEFIEEVKNRIVEYLEEYPIETVEIHQVLKNNGVLETGLVILLKGSNISPNIYLESYYQLYTEGHLVEELLADIAAAYIFAKEQVEDKEYEPYDAKQAEKHLFIRLINQEQNEELLQKCPYIPYLDLAITFRYIILSDGERIGSALVSFDDMKRWGYDLGTLYKHALSSMRALFEPRTVSLEKMLRERMAEFEEDICDIDNPLYVLTNDIGMNGASFMLYDDVLETFAREQKSSFYILPSSIHEVLLLPEKEEMNVAFLAETVREVNRMAVAKIEYLSDSVYRYDFNSKCVSICELEG